MMAPSTVRFLLHPVAAAALLSWGPHAAAQDAAPSVVTVTGRAERAAVTGFGTIPLSRTPLQAQVVGAEQLADAGVASLAGLTRFDASVSDAYNAEGYWSSLTVRGYVLDNRFNFRRDGLPINAETALPLGNKDRVEVLKGTSGIQAGTSAPGGLVNLVVKRPVERLREARVDWQQTGTVTVGMDWSERFGPGGQAGLRINASADHLDPQVREARGSRSLVAVATDLRLEGGGRLEAEVESGHQSQPSVPGFSPLGPRVPTASSIDPRVNLNNQRWTLPVVLDGLTGSVRWQQPLASGWQLTAHAMTQRLRSDDRTAFPYGAYAPDYSCQWCDRYAPDGTFSFWEYRSEGERRRSDALQVTLAGSARWAGVEHALQAAVLASRFQARYRDQVFDLAGTGRIDGRLQSAPSAGYTSPNTQRDERSTEWSLQDVMTLSPAWQLWAGLRHTRLQRDSQLTSPESDGLRATHYTQAATSPWMAVAYALSPRTTAYASWGQGLESEVVANRARYTNRGQALPALKSRQWEAGLKHGGRGYELSLATFDIDRPQAVDRGACDVVASCTRVIDGSARHRGVEGQWRGQAGDWRWEASALLLNAQRQGSSQAVVNGLRPVNVPDHALRLGGGYRLPLWGGIDTWAALITEGDRMVLPDDNTTRIPSWSRLDLSARWDQTLGSTRLTWRVGVDNATDRRAWREAPYQFGHAYLFPLAPRTWRIGLQARL